MAAIQHNGFRKITLLLIVVCMHAGLLDPIVCDAFYNSFLTSDNLPIELSVPDNSTSIDCIVESATQISFQRPEAKKNGADQVNLIRPGCSVLFSSARLNLLTVRFYMFVLLAMMIAGTLSYFHILYIHQKDGHK